MKIDRMERGNEVLTQSKHCLSNLPLQTFSTGKLFLTLTDACRYMYILPDDIKEPFPSI